MATDEQVAEQRAKVDEARQALRVARSGGGVTTSRESDNDHKLAVLEQEEKNLAAELARLTGAGVETPAAPEAPAEAEAEAPQTEAPAEDPQAEAPAEAPQTEAPGTSRRGGRNQTEG